MKITIIGILSIIITAMFFKPDTSEERFSDINNIKIPRAWTSQEVLKKTDLYKEVNASEDTITTRVRKK